MLFKVLRQQERPNDYATYMAALEWELTDPIVIEKREDLKSPDRWQKQIEPYQHQVGNLITFCRRLPVTLLADDVGLGKTISAGLIVSELIARKRLSKILIVCPKLLGPQWQEELKTKFQLDSQISIGSDLRDADPGDLGATITTYNSARLYLDEVPKDRYQMLILDEAHKLRNLYGTQKPPQVALRFRTALEQRRFTFVLMLTATPIQNRLWDLYSLVDLLTVARGHLNPFGNEGQFVRKFIADNREDARELKPESREEFRSIVYGYMSRVRRGDARLYFPQRKVQMHKVAPTPTELELIAIVGDAIQNMNRLAQISILQALTSSPHALSAQLQNMARNGSVPEAFANAVKSLVSKMRTSAKLIGLAALVDKLARESGEKWRLVVFTGRRETQTTIQEFLETRGLKVGIINGSSGPKNQDTLSQFRQNPPTCRVIVSTEAGSEGINLQVANVLVNYDLPWNPMIVEQRIGRVQRLASEHASVAIFNVILQDTFEEFIVGRLMEKLQMATQAIGDIESLLQASGMNGDEEGSEISFEEKIRSLVVAALAGKDVKLAAQQAAASIAEAKQTLEQQETTINQMLGGMDAVGSSGPRAPTLPSVNRSMSAQAFSLNAFASLGATATEQEPGVFLIEGRDRRGYVRFNEDGNGSKRGTLYAPGTAEFGKLVSEIAASGVHDVKDIDRDPAATSEGCAAEWVAGFGGSLKRSSAGRTWRNFYGTALVRVRATVAHDSYERLVEVNESNWQGATKRGSSEIRPIGLTIESPLEIGVPPDRLEAAAREDPAIRDFCRFYLERKAQEVRAVEGDAAKKKKLEDDFTPRLEFTLVGLKGTVSREVETSVAFQIDGSADYSVSLTIIPSRKQIIDSPRLECCAKSGKTVPELCLKKCEISGARVLEKYLLPSAKSGRLALPEHTVICAMTGARLLSDEVETSAISGLQVDRTLLRTSGISGLRAERENFSVCAFSGVEALKRELTTSELSGKLYRTDQEMTSSLSGKKGHESEFVTCSVTGQHLAKVEAERCEETGAYVRPGILQICASTNKRVLPSELDQCTATGKRVLRRLLVKSSVSGRLLQETIAVRGSNGSYCLPDESKTCVWSETRCHPADIRVCRLTGNQVLFSYVDEQGRLRDLIEMLEGRNLAADETNRWVTLAEFAESTLRRGKCRVEAAVSSLTTDKKCLAVSMEARALLGFQRRSIGFIYSIPDGKIVGRPAIGKREQSRWVPLGT